MPRLSVHQHLVISAVAQDDHGLTIDVRDHSGSRHWIRFQLPRAGVEECFSRMSSWMDRATRLTYVKGGDHGVLIDDSEFFRFAFADD